MLAVTEFYFLNILALIEFQINSHVLFHHKPEINMAQPNFYLYDFNNLKYMLAIIEFHINSNISFRIKRKKMHQN